MSTEETKKSNAKSKTLTQQFSRGRSNSCFLVLKIVFAHVDLILRAARSQKN